MMEESLKIKLEENKSLMKDGEEKLSLLRGSL